MEFVSEIRAGELASEWTGASDAGLVFIGRISTPWTSLPLCPRHGRSDGPLCKIEIFERWVPALRDIAEGMRIEVFYWLHRSRRDLLLQSPRNDGVTLGTFSIRSPNRPNPIGTSVVRLERLDGAALFVRGLDCLDGTPLIDLKPDRKEFASPAPPTQGGSRPGEA